MQLYNHFPLVTILLPMVIALVMSLVNDEKTARYITTAAEAVLALLSAILLVIMLNAQVGTFTYTMGSFPAPWGNELRAGPFEAAVSCAFAIVMLFAINGGALDTVRDIKKEKVKYYYLMINLLTASLMALVYTNDIFTGYVFIEINTLAACIIVAVKDSGETIKATIKYMSMSILGSALFLLSTIILYSITGHLLMEPAHRVIGELAATGRYIVPLVMTLVLYMISVSVKSALFPFHSWLPDAHGYATTTSSAVLSSLVLKGYIILLIKLVTRVYGIDVISMLGIMPVLFALGLLAMIMGSIIAMIQKDIKRMIAYSTIAHIGYIFMGIGLNTPAGYAAASFHVIAHAFTKSMLFISAGALINTVGSKNISDMTGAARKDKIAGAAFLAGALSLIGIPLFAGFPSKFYLANAAMQSSGGTWIAIVFLALSTFLNAIYYVPVLYKLYSNNGSQILKARASQAHGIKTAFTASAPALICLLAANIALGVFYVPLINALEQGFTWLA